MARKKKKKRRTLPRQRDPFWRARRLLGQKRVESHRAYKRSATRRAERAARDDAE